MQPDKHGRGHNVLRLLAAAAVVAFVVCGVQGLKVACSRRTDGHGNLNSSDSFLLQALQVNGGAEKIVHSISDLPPLQPLAIIAPTDNVYASILLATIGSITWPHEICLIHVGNANVKKTLDTLRDDHFAAALFYDLAPPFPNSGDRHVGSLTIVPISK